MGLRAAPPSMAPPRITINVPCKLGWMKLSGYDNTGNTNSSMTLSVEVTKSHELKTIDFTKSITESSREKALKMHAEVSAKATYAPVEASVSSGIEHSSVVKDLLSSTTELTREENSKLSITTKQDFTIGAGDQLHFYQRVFEGPGMSCKLEITQVSSDPLLEDQWDKVDMTVITRPQRFIDDLKVEYGENESDVSDHYVRELSGHSADINHGQNGKYAWLVPVWTYDVEEAATSFEICIQDTEQRGMEDMARGTGGKYRYIYAICDGDQEHRVIDAKLVRSSSMLSKDEQVKMLGKGWVGGDRDINEGRGGDFLYLAYKLF